MKGRISDRLLFEDIPYVRGEASGAPLVGRRAGDAGVPYRAAGDGGRPHAGHRPGADGGAAERGRRAADVLPGAVPAAGAEPPASRRPPADGRREAELGAGREAQPPVAARAPALGLAALLLLPQPPLVDPARDPRRPARPRRRRGRLREQRGEPDRGRLAVAPLGAVLRRAYGDAPRRPAGPRAAPARAPSTPAAAPRCCARSKRSSTCESLVLTCCPPGPDDREKRHMSSASGRETEPRMT